jgi:hypothetical protein
MPSRLSQERSKTSGHRQQGRQVAGEECTCLLDPGHTLDQQPAIPQPLSDDYVLRSVLITGKRERWKIQISTRPLTPRPPLQSFRRSQKWGRLSSIFPSSLTLSNTSSFLTRSVQLIFSILLQHHILKLFRYFWYTFQSFQVSAPYKR